MRYFYVDAWDSILPKLHEKSRQNVWPHTRFPNSENCTSILNDNKSEKIDEVAQFFNEISQELGLGKNCLRKIRDRII